MEAKTKQRMVGGLVLIALIAIFLPLLFHRSHPSMNLALSTEAPKAPAQPQVELQLPPDEHSNNTAHTSTVSDAASPASSVQALEASEVQINASGASPSAESVAEKTPAVTQKILNTAPAPAVQAQPPSSTNSSVPTPPPAAAATQPATTTPSTAPSSQPEPTPSATSQPSEPAITPLHSKSASVSLHSKSVFIVQIASFANSDNALRLVKQLRAQGIEARVNKSPSNITRVYVGPILTQAQALKLQHRLKQQMHLNSVIKKNT